MTRASPKDCEFRSTDWRSCRAERPEEIRPALERAIASGKPAIVEVVVDANEPPMPAKATATQALHFAEALAKGQPDGGRIALTLFRNKMSELL